MVRRLALALAAVTIAATACNRPPGSQGLEHIDDRVVFGVLAGEVVGPSAESDVCPRMDPFTFDVREVRFDASDRYRPGPAEPPIEPLPGAGTSLTVWIPDELVEPVGRPGRRALALANVYDLCDAGERRWLVRYAFAPDGALLDPRSPERSRLADDLEAMRRPGESDLETALAFLNERARYDLAVAEGEPVPATPRRDALRASRTDETDRAAALASEWAARPFSERQLPVDLEHDRAFTERLRRVLGLDRWARWEVLFLYDAATAEETGWAALVVHDAGIIGPYYLDPTQTISVAPTAHGPPTATVSVVVWPPGEPRTVTGGSGTVDPVPLPGSATEIDAADRATLDAGGGIVVDLRSRTVTIDVVSQEAFRRLMIDHADRTHRGGEEDRPD